MQPRRVWGGGGVQVDMAISRLKRLYQGQVALSHTSPGWRCDVLMMLCVSDLAPWEDLKTKQRKSSNKTVATSESRETLLGALQDADGLLISTFAVVSQLY